MGGLAALKRFARETAPETCDLCSVPLGEPHQHLLGPWQGGNAPPAQQPGIAGQGTVTCVLPEDGPRHLLCVCDACALLFSSAETRYKRVPRTVRELVDFRLSAERWSALPVPTGMVYFVLSSEEQRVKAWYPSPAGPAEALIELPDWDGIVEDNPVLRGMAADVEALLVNRVGGAQDYFLAPIDQCYRLTGLIRRHWSGFSGGDAVWREIREFFAGLRRQAAPVSVGSHA